MSIKLKVKQYRWSAGVPIVILNKKDANKYSINLSDRVVISYNSRRIIALVDLSSKIALPNEIVLSSEALDILKCPSNSFVTLTLASRTYATDLILKKLNGARLGEKEVFTIIKSIVDNELSESEIAFFISAVYEKGMDIKETYYMTKAIAKTGESLGLKGNLIVDKHSIGGIAGNRTTPLIVSICASAGLIFPKTSSRAITSAAGTADVMETICRVEFSKEELKKIIKSTNACLAWGGSLKFAPADDKIIKVESKVHLDPEPNLIASILAKKISVGAKYVLIDIPYGKFAKVDYKQAINLKRKFITIGKRFNIKIKCLLTNGEEPIGNGIGPVLELRDILSVFNNNGPYDLRDKSIFLAGEIFDLCGKTKKGEGRKLAEYLLSSGKAFEKFKQIVRAQEGNIDNLSNLSLAKFYFNVNSNKSGKIIDLDNKKINLLARIAGSPQNKKAGLYLYKHKGDSISKGERLLTIYSQSKSRLSDAIDFFNENKIIIIK